MKIAYGSATGHTHRTFHYNNQDAVAVVTHDNYLIGILADGCGSGANSETGAQLAVDFLSRRIASYLESGQKWETCIEEDLLHYTKKLIALQGGDEETFVRNFLLYTLVGLVVCDEKVSFFSCGDGVIVKDNEVELIDQHNRPRYLNNRFLGEEAGRIDFRECPLSDCHRFLIATDGFAGVLEGIRNGELTEYASLEAFMAEERHFSDPTRLPKFLVNHAGKGLIRDDCTVILADGRL